MVPSASGAGLFPWLWVGVVLTGEVSQEQANGFNRPYKGRRRPWLPGHSLVILRFPERWHLVAEGLIFPKSEEIWGKLILRLNLW